MSDDILDSGDVNNGQRPQFLTVLCILTFIGSGLGVLGSLLGIVGSSALSAFMPAGTILVSLIGLVYPGLCLFGAIQMWGLKKQGFTLYLAGSIIAILVTLYNAFTIQSTMSEINSQFSEIEGVDPVDFTGAASGVAWTSTIIGILIIVAFVAMYNANKKALVN